MTTTSEPAPAAPILHLDATAIKVLAHPLRSRLLSALRAGGPATATALAERIGTNTGATSYHLRKLASVGLVEETGEGHGRERPWRAATEMHSFTQRDVVGDPDAQAASDWLRRYYLRSFAERYERWLDIQETWPLEWQEAADASDRLVHVSPARLAACRPSSARSIERYAEPAAADPDARRSKSTSMRSRSPRCRDDRNHRSAKRRRRYLALIALRWLPTGLLIPVERAADAVPWTVADRDRHRLLGPGVRRPGPRAADRRAVRFARAPADPDPRHGDRHRLARPCSISPSRCRCSSARWSCQGVFRALDSGPLEAWYVDATLAADPAAPGSNPGSVPVQQCPGRGHRRRGAAVRGARRPCADARDRDPGPAARRGARPLRRQPGSHRGADARAPCRSRAAGDRGFRRRPCPA